MSRGKILSILTLLLLSLLSPLPALGGPPFFTGDPEPVEYGHHEIYYFTTVDYAGNADFLRLPAIEYNAGVFPETQFQILVPLVYSSTGANNTYGLGDTELGVKYRFVEETAGHPQMGVFPMLEVPTGNSGRGLGSGNVWLKLPVWLQKSWGEWESYGGAGYAINSASLSQNYLYGGWLIQRNFGERLTLGGEIFAQQGSNENTILNFGGNYKIGPNFSFLFSIGRSLSEANHSYSYLGLYRTW